MLEILTSQLSYCVFSASDYLVLLIHCKQLHGAETRECSLCSIFSEKKLLLITVNVFLISYLFSEWKVIILELLSG
jgi:hypothetical protein